jgi:hypothetical protein
MYPLSHFFETFYCGGAPHSLTLLNPKQKSYNMYKREKKTRNKLYTKETYGRDFSHIDKGSTSTAFTLCISMVMS